MGSAPAIRKGRRGLGAVPQTAGADQHARSLTARALFLLPARFRFARSAVYCSTAGRALFFALMKVQTKIVLLLVLMVAAFVGGLVAFKWSEQRKYKRLAEARAVERERSFEDFLRVRGDNLKALVDDSTVWDDLVLALMKGDAGWAETNFDEDELVNFQANAVWIYKPDRSLFYSLNNRYAKTLRELPVPPEAFEALFAGKRECHFFLETPEGWMEIRGATVHPSRDRFRETKPQGYLFAGHFWITENIRRMSLFTGYSIRVLPASAPVPAAKGGEELGRIRFSRPMPGWDGKPAAQIVVENDSPIIRELNRASERLFHWLLGAAAALLLLLSVSLYRWVRRPLRFISRNLQCENPEALEKLQRNGNEFGKLAALILQYRCTEKKLHQAEDELRHAQKLEAVGRLAGGVAHDFNNLLTAILGYSQLLERRLAHDPDGLEHARLIHKAGEQAAGLTRQLLAFSRKQLLQPRVLDLNALVRDMDKLLGRVIGEHIRIDLHTQAEDARVLADPNQLEQVILNLGVNARDAMPSGGTLLIATRNIAHAQGSDGRLAGECVRLSVTDTGSGMDDETRTRIFEPFFTTKGPGRGTGLGLATVYGIVKQSQGVICVESELGKGSTFVIDLPRSDGVVEAPPPPPPPIERSDKAETVLVVEDEEVVRMLVCAVLSEAGYEVLCAGSPTEALQLVQGHRGSIDLLVTDVVMPGMHGPAMARLLAPLQPCMRVLYVSGYSENDISDQGVIDPGIEVLQKPFTHEVLIRKVREVLQEDASPAGKRAADAAPVAAG